MEYLPGIAMSLSAVLLALMSPGPNILAVIGTSMSIGRTQGAALATGVAVGSCVWASIAVLGLTTLLTTYAEILLVIKVVGGCYLIWLGYKSLCSAMSKKQLAANHVSGVVTHQQYFTQGLTVQLTNPKAALATTAIVSLGIQGGAPVWVGLVLVAGITLLSLIAHLFYAIAFSTRSVVAIYVNSRRRIECALGAFFMFAGIRLLTDRS